MAKQMSLQKHCPVVPVTAISFTCNDRVLIVGKGSFVTAYLVSSGEEIFSEGVLCLDNGATASIHGFAVNDLGVTSSACLTYGHKLLRVISFQDYSFELASDCLSFCDSIKESKLLSRTHNQTSAILGFAHNFLEIWRWSGKGVDKVMLKRFHCVEQSVLHCMSFFGTSVQDLQIGVGTCMNELLIWNIGQELDSGVIEQKAMPVTDRLLGHQGGVFCVRWNDSGNAIVSCSDDRSLRLWIKSEASSTTSEDTLRWTLKWTAWGHTARVWDVQLGEDYIVSCGEDTVTRVWNYQGQSVKSFLGHAGRNIWVVAISRNDESGRSVCASGGNDAATKLWSLNRADESNCLSGQVLQLTSKNMISSLIMDEEPEGNRHAEKDFTEQPEQKRAKNGGKKKAKDLDNDMVMFIRRTHAGRVIAAQADGTLWQFDPLQGGGRMKLNLVSEGVIKFASCAMHPKGQYLALGDATGCIHMFQVLGLQEASEIYSWKASESRILDLWWGEEASTSRCTLFAACPRACVTMWQWTTIGGVPREASPLHYCSLNLSAAAVVASLCLTSSGKAVLCGDTRGHISLFTLPDPDDGPPPIVKPLSVKRRAHGTHMVTNLIERRGYFYSSGFDGWVHTFTLSENYEFKLVASTSGGPISSITDVLFQAYPHAHLANYGKEGLILAGFHASKFILYDVSNSYLISSTECGGHRRPNTFCFDNYQDFNKKNKIGTNFENFFSFVFSANTKNGPKLSLISPSQIPLPRPNLGVPFHGRELTSSVWCGQSHFVTASQDCGVKLSEVNNGIVCVVQSLLPHSTCVRALAFSRCTATRGLLVSAGGKLTTKFWSINLNFEDQIPVHLMSTKIDPCIDQDHRILSVEALVFDSAAGLHLVVSGDSAGVLSLMMVSQFTGKFDILYSFNQSAPVLSLQICRLMADNSFVVGAGSTNGEVQMWNFSGFRDSKTAEDKYDVSCHDLISFRAHSMGTNAMQMQLIHKEFPNGDVEILRICSGGDDQALTVSYVFIDIGNDQPTVIGVDANTLLGASGSALKGVSVLSGGNVLVSVGYDQRLTMWSLPAYSSAHILRFNTETSADIGRSLHVRDAIINTVKTCDMSSESPALHWTCTQMCDVSDIAGLAVSETCEGLLQVAVFGQGVQLFGVRSSL